MLADYKSREAQAHCTGSERDTGAEQTRESASAYSVLTKQNADDLCAKPYDDFCYKEVGSLAYCSWK